MISLKAVAKSFGTLRAVDGIDLDVPTGKCLGLLGPNGAGKSTTINVIVGLLKPDAGTVSIDGESDPTRPDVRRRLGVTPQALAIYENLTAEENLAFFGGVYGIGGDKLRGRVDWALEFAGLADRRNDRTATFSGGMKRRLNIACALLHDPPVLLFDEPTVGVDPQSRNRIFDSIESLKAQGRTILYTTHYMEEAARLCDVIAVMDKGRVLATGTLDELIRAHGGPSTVSAEFESAPRDTSAVPGTWDGATFSVETPEPNSVVARLAGLGVPLKTLNVVRPNLEAVFLNLTGRTLRDE